MVCLGSQQTQNEQTFNLGLRSTWKLRVSENNLQDVWCEPSWDTWSWACSSAMPELWPSHIAVSPRVELCEAQLEVFWAWWIPKLVAKWKKPIFFVCAHFCIPLLNAKGFIFVSSLDDWKHEFRIHSAWLEELCDSQLMKGLYKLWSQEDREDPKAQGYSPAMLLPLFPWQGHTEKWQPVPLWCWEYHLMSVSLNCTSVKWEWWKHTSTAYSAKAITKYKGHSEKLSPE